MLLIYLPPLFCFSKFQLSSEKPYSEEQLDYFNTLPADRLPKIKDIMSRYSAGNDDEAKKVI